MLVLRVNNNENIFRLLIKLCFYLIKTNKQQNYCFLIMNEI